MRFCVRLHRSNCTTFKNVAPIQPLLFPSVAKAIGQVTNNKWVSFPGDLAGSGKILLLFLRSTLDVDLTRSKRCCLAREPRDEATPFECIGFVVQEVGNVIDDF